MRLINVFKLSLTLFVFGQKGSVQIGGNRSCLFQHQNSAGKKFLGAVTKISHLPLTFFQINTMSGLLHVFLEILNPMSFFLKWKKCTRNDFS